MRGGQCCRAGVPVLILLAAALPARSAWQTVTVTLQESDGSRRQVVGSALSYGYYVREFTPKGVRDRLKVEKFLPFADRDVRLNDLAGIRFDVVEDGTTGLTVPVVMHLRIQKRKKEPVLMERKVSELRGFSNPKPVLLIVETAAGEVELDLTPPYDDDGRDQYRPVLEIRFD